MNRTLVSAMRGLNRSFSSVATSCPAEKDTIELSSPRGTCKQGALGRCQAHEAAGPALEQLRLYRAVDAVNHHQSCGREPGLSPPEPF